MARERIRQRQERAIKATAYVNVLPGYRSARDRAQEQLACLVTADDGTVEPRLWVPKTVSPHATWAYSWIKPPSRSRRRTRA